VRTVWNTQINCVGRMQTSVIYTNPARTSQEAWLLHYRGQPVNAIWGIQSLFTLRTIRNTQMHCSHNVGISMCLICPVILLTSPIVRTNETRCCCFSWPKQSSRSLGQRLCPHTGLSPMNGSIQISCVEGDVTSIECLSDEKLILPPAILID
jgi:hypothetical protein